MSDSTNYVGNVAPVVNSDVTFPAGTATGVTNDLPAQQALDRLILTGSGFAFAGAPFNLRGGIQNSGSGNVLNTPLQQLASGFVDNSGGTLILNGAVDLAADLYVHGSGATTFGAPIGGTGAIDCAGPGNVTFGAAPTFTGSIQVSGGTLFGNAAIGQPIDAYGGGTLRGSGPFNGAVYAGEFGRLFPGIDATPVNLAIGSLSIDRGIVELAFSANNAQHSALAVTGGVAISSGLLQLDFGTAPPVSSTFSNLVTAPGTISGCFDETRAASPNVVVVAQCTASAVSALVKAVDRIFAGGFNYP